MSDFKKNKKKCDKIWNWSEQKWDKPPKDGEIALWPSTNRAIPDF